MMSVDARISDVVYRLVLSCTDSDCIAKDLSRLSASKTRETGDVASVFPNKNGRASCRTSIATYHWQIRQR